MSYIYYHKRVIVMQNKNNNKKTKTLCTIETSDIDLQDHKPAKEMNITDGRACRYQKQNGQQSPIIKRKSQLKTSTPTRTTNKFFYNTQKIQRTPENKEKNKSKSLLHRTVSRSKSRMKTDYSASNDLAMKSLFCKSTKSMKDKFYNPFEDHYQMDTYQILEEISTEKKQRVFIAKKADKLYLMKKTKDSSIKKMYQNESAVKLKLFHAKWKNLVKPLKMYCEKNWIYSISQYHGSCLSWQNPSHIQVIKKLLKNEGVVLKFMIKEIAKGINQLSSKGFAHSSVRFENISMKIKQFKRTINVQGNVKLANLGYCFSIKDKNMLLQMPNTIYTPPEIINLKLFENRERFDRELIQYISYYDEAWYIDTWALGILVLQLIAGESISIQKAESEKKDLSNSQEDDDQVSFDVQKQEMQLKPKIPQNMKQSARNNQITLADILQAQKSLLIQTESQIQKINFDKKFQALLIRMLSINPLNRPSPKQIIKDL